MRRNALLSLAFLFVASCATDIWVPVDGSVSRPPFATEHVLLLGSLPQQPYTVIGIITPEAGEYETPEEAVEAMRAEAAKNGADAIFIESPSGDGRWRFGSDWRSTSAESFSELLFRAKAIVWNIPATATAHRSTVVPASRKPVESPKKERVATIDGPVTQTRDFPTAKPVPGKPGYVYSLDPKGGLIDVTGYNSGDKAKDPYTHQIFIVP